MSVAPLVQAQQLSKRFGAEPLFDGVSISVSDGERVALVGPNGSGKSTLLKLLAKLETPDSGTVRMRGGVSVVYVAQEDRFDETLTAGQTLEKALHDGHCPETEIDARINRVLGRIGFQDMDAPVASLSGGWKKRLALARGLALEPDLLLLDEPTNHLDLDGILWLEELTRNAPFSILFVSHDRTFIEHVGTRVLEINAMYPQGYFSAEGGYEKFIERRDAYIAGLQAAQASLANKVRRETEWLRQGAKARTTKSKYRIAEAKKMIDQLKGLSLEEQRVDLEFSASSRKTKELISVEGVSKGFGERSLFRDINLTLRPGTRLGIAGPNGSGKSTFLRVLLGELEPDAGRVVKAPNLKVAFFDQARKQLNRTQTLRDALAPAGDNVFFNGRSIHVASWAERFLFSFDQLGRPVESFSGGEQARILLARLMLVESDVIVFDEPTNDLDISTLEVLEEGFIEFPGAVVLVTHDRYLLDQTATVVLGLSSNGGQLYASASQFEGAYVDAATATRQSASAKAKSERQKISKQELQELSSIEGKISKAETQLEKMQSEMLAPAIASDPAALRKHCEKIATEQKSIDALYVRWELLEQKKRNSSSNK